MAKTKKVDNLNRTAMDLGSKACQKNQMAVPAWDEKLMKMMTSEPSVQNISLTKSWLKGWTICNLEKND